jgi:hypothetical protein
MSHIPSITLQKSDELGIVVVVVVVVIVVPNSSSVGFTRVCDVAFVTHAVFASSGDDDADSGERARD